jgi:hypothetical protein
MNRGRLIALFTVTVTAIVALLIADRVVADRAEIGAN